MRIHPAPKKRDIGPDRCCCCACDGGGRQRKLRRLPHVFGRVLELPFSSDAEVHILEDSSIFRFTASLSDLHPLPLRACAVDIHPGVTKIVIRQVTSRSSPSSGDEDQPPLLLEDLEIDRWRFRLPSGTRPELATASNSDGELIVVIPKGGPEDDQEKGGGDVSGFSHLVIVQ